MYGDCHCGNVGDFDDLSRQSASSCDSSESGAGESLRSAAFNVDYRNVTPLFRNIEKENWEGVLLFLTTGKWSNSILSSTNEHLKSPSPEIQVKTWVTSYNRKGAAEWSQLPLHAAISYLAPHVVVEKLAKMYPKAIQCTDNEGMLPIHLAFGFGASDTVLSLLLEPFPASVNAKGLGGRLPHECCELGPNKIRGKVFKVITDETKKRVISEIDTEWRHLVISAQKSLGMPHDSPKNKKLSDFLLELMRDRKDLMEIRARSQGRRSSSGAAAPKDKGTKISKSKASEAPVKVISTTATISTRQQKSPKFSL
jgi:hypothetical protein